jgi:hypothetical protein
MNDILEILFVLLSFTEGKVKKLTAGYVSKIVSPFNFKQ